MILKKFLNLTAIQAAVSTIPEYYRNKGRDVLNELIRLAYFAAGKARGPRGEIVGIERGQTIISLRKFAQNFDFSLKIMQNILKTFSRCGLIRTTTSRRHTIITLLFYDLYHEPSKSYYKKATQKIEQDKLEVAMAEHVPSRLVETPPCGVHRTADIDNIKNKSNLLNSRSSNVKYSNNTLYNGCDKQRDFSEKRTDIQISGILKSEDIGCEFGRGKLVRKLEDKYPRKYDDFRTRAYLIQASRGKNPLGFAIKLLTSPEWSPADWALEQAESEKRAARMLGRNKKSVLGPRGSVGSTGLIGDMLPYVLADILGPERVKILRKPVKCGYKNCRERAKYIAQNRSPRFKDDVLPSCGIHVQLLEMKGNYDIKELGPVAEIDRTPPSQFHCPGGSSPRVSAGHLTTENTENTEGTATAKVGAAL